MQLQADDFTLNYVIIIVKRLLMKEKSQYGKSKVGGWAECEVLQEGQWQSRDAEMECCKASG